jgi:hypothetical protein
LTLQDGFRIPLSLDGDGRKGNGRNIRDAQFLVALPTLSKVAEADDEFSEPHAERQGNATDEKKVPCSEPYRLVRFQIPVTWTIL